MATAAATFPAKTAIYCNDNNSATVAAVVNNNCCRLKPAGEYASTDGESSRSARSMSNSNTEDEEDYGTINVSNNGNLLYRQTTTAAAAATNLIQTTGASLTTTTMTCVVSACDGKNNPANPRSCPLENDTASAENIAAASNVVEQLAIQGKVANAGDMLANKLFPSRIHGEIYTSGARLVSADAGYSNSSSSSSSGGGSQITAQGNLHGGEGCVAGLLSDDACVAYVRQANEPSQASAGVFQGDGVEQRINMDDKSRQQDGFDNQTGSSLSSSSGSNVAGVVGSGVGGSVVVIGSGGSVATSCDSVRSDTGESSTYSSLSSPESQSQSSSAHDGLPVANSGGSCAQQAARQPQLSRINASNNGNNNPVQQNVVLTMNGSAVVAQQQQQQQQQQFQQAITVPRGWKRICTNGVIIYIR